MSRVGENNEALERLTKYAMEEEYGTYEELVVCNLSAITSMLVDISKSLAVIADNMSSQTGAEGSEE